jgi:hypothetical protein
MQVFPSVKFLDVILSGTLTLVLCLWKTVIGNDFDNTKLGDEQ